MTNLIQIAEAILGRLLRAEDGIPDSKILVAEKVLQVKLPLVLREFYLWLGNNEIFTDAHNHLYHLEELEIVDDLLIFMAENQGVVLWGIKKEDFFMDEPEVYQINPDNALEVYREDKNLSVFLKIMLYYQAAQGGFLYTGWLYEYQDALTEIAATWEKVIEDQGLHLWWQNGKIIFALDSADGMFDFLTASARSKELLDELVNEYGFEADSNE